MGKTERIAAAYIYTAESSSPLRNSYIEFDSEDGTIVSLGECADNEQVMDVAIIPGMVNSHCHCELSHLQGKFLKGTGMAGFIDQINALRDWAGFEVKQQLVQKWMDKMWDDGVSAMADISNDDSSFAVKASHKMYTRTFLEVFGTEPEQCSKVMDDVAQLQVKAQTLGIDAAPTPHSCYTMSPALLKASASAGLKSGYLSYHSQESQEEEDLIRYGRGAMYENRRRSLMSTPPVKGTSSLVYFIDSLADIGAVPHPEHVLLVHNVCTTELDARAAMQAFKKPYFALCPLSNLFIHNALPDVEMLWKMGLKLTVGTDSLSSNDNLDMVSEIVCLHENFPSIPMGEIVRWATVNGAEFLDKEDVLGSFVIGKRPGIVLVEGIDPEGNFVPGCRSRRII